MKILLCIWKKIDILPKHRPYDYFVDLQNEVQVAFGTIFNLSDNELIELQKYIGKNLGKKFIWCSKSPIGTPILFVKKKWYITDVCGLPWPQQSNNKKLSSFIVNINPLLMTFKFILKNKKDDEKHVCIVLSKLWDMGLYAKLEKCKFHQL